MWHTVPHDRIAPVYLLEGRKDACAWMEVLTLSACAAVNVSWFFVLFTATSALIIPYVISRLFEVFLVDAVSRYMLGNTTGGMEKKFFPAVSLVLLVCDQKKGLTWFSAVLSTHTSQGSWWEMQKLTVFEIKPRIWLTMPWRRYLTTKWKNIQTEGTKAFLLNILLWSSLLGGVSITKLQLLSSFYNSFIETTAVCCNLLHFEADLCKILASAVFSGGWKSVGLRVKCSQLFALDAVPYVLMLPLHADPSVNCLAMSVRQPRSWNGETYQGTVEEEAQSQLDEVLYHAEQPLQLLSLLQILLIAGKEILKSWIQMQQGYCGKFWGYG